MSRFRSGILPLLLLSVLFVALSAEQSRACPFCGVVESSFAQRRETADWLFLVEAVDTAEPPPRYLVHRLLKSPPDDATFVVQREYPLDLQSTIPPGKLALAWAQPREGKNLVWSAIPVNELSLRYFAQAPDLRVPEAERLQYFAPYLQHADEQIAEDAFREFGLASFEAVSEVANRFASPQVRAWIASPGVPQSRKGFYGLLLGLATDPADRRANLSFLREQILLPRDDFRAGFDGQLAGYILLAGEPGLKLIEESFLAKPQAAVGDVRHALAALRFYQQYGKQISTERLAAAAVKALDRPEFAEATITDLARWQAWQYADKIAALYGQARFDRPEIKRAIVGYLLACPTETGKRQLTCLRKIDPNGVASAEDVLRKFNALAE